MIARTLPTFLPIVLACSLACAQQQGEPLRPHWCRELPRPEYKNLERVDVGDGWFEVYRVRPGVFAIYEPHQFEEVISYLILGSKRALLFDTGMGIGKISAVVARLTTLPVTALNSYIPGTRTSTGTVDADWLDPSATREKLRSTKPPAMEAGWSARAVPPALRD